MKRVMKRVWIEHLIGTPGIWVLGVAVTRYGTLMFHLGRHTWVVGRHIPLKPYLQYHT